MEKLKPKKQIQSIEKWLSDETTKCYSCGQSSFCNVAGLDPMCQWNQDLSDKDLSKPGILIIDDNPGIVSFLEDDLEELNDEGLIKLNDYNVFTFTTKHAAYHLLGVLRQHGDLNIKIAIVDITLGGSMQTPKGNTKLTGVDAFEPLLELNPKLKYIFYTGNQMNDHVKVIADIMKTFTKITGEKITDHLLFKTQLNMNDRRMFLYDKLFK